MTMTPEERIDQAERNANQSFQSMNGFNVSPGEMANYQGQVGIANGLFAVAYAGLEIAASIRDAAVAGKDARTYDRIVQR